MIVLSSKYAGSQPTHDFTTDLTYPLSFKKDLSGNIVNKITLVSLSTWNSWYNISATRKNNVLRYFNNSVYKTITTPSGNYSMEDYISAIYTGFIDNGDYDNSNPNDPQFYITFTMNPNVGKIYVAFSNGYRLDCRLSNNANSPNTILGAGDAEYTTDGYLPNNADIMDGVTDFLVNLSPICDGASYRGPYRSSVVYTFTIREPPSGPIYREPSFPLLIPITTDICYHLRLFLTDQSGNIIDLQGEELTATFLIQ